MPRKKKTSLSRQTKHARAMAQARARARAAAQREISWQFLTENDLLTRQPASAFQSQFNYIDGLLEMQRISDKNFLFGRMQFSLINDISLAKCIGVISLANARPIDELCRIAMLNIEVVQEILQNKEHIQKIFKYIPNAKKNIHPDELNKIVALTEILIEFMRRLSCQNATITDEELMLNARLLKSAFGVTGMHIDEKWVHYFRFKFEPSNSINKPLEEMHKTYFYVRDILTHIQHMLHPEVVVYFNKNFQKNSNDLILICTDILGKNLNVARKHSKHIENTDQEMSGDDKVNDFSKNQVTITNTTEEKSEAESEEESQEVCVKEEIELGDYYVNDNVNATSNEPNELCTHENNLAEEIMLNDDSSDVIEIYAVIDEDDDDNDGNLMDVDEQTETTLITIDESTTKMNEEYCIKQEIEDPEYKTSEAGFLKNSPELLMEQIKEEPIEIYSSEDLKDESEKKFANSQVEQFSIQHFSIQEIEHPEYTTAEAGLLKYSQELLTEQIKKEPIDTKDETEEEFVESHVEQFSIKHFSIQEIEHPQYTTAEASLLKYSHELLTEQIKKEPIDTKDESEKEFVELHVEQPAKQHISFQEIEYPEYTTAEAGLSKSSQELLTEQIKKELIDIKYESEEEFVELSVEQPFIQHISVDSSMESEIIQEPSELYSDNCDNNEICMVQEESEDEPQAMQQMCAEPIEPVKKLASIETINIEVDNASGQNKEQTIKEQPKLMLTIDDVMHNDIATNLKYGGHLTEERALHIGRILNSKPYGKLYCEVLLLDPIICTYINIEKNKLPTFSESALRLAFQLVLGEELYNCQYNYRISAYDSKLYRQLLLLTYSTKYKSSQLMNIRKSDFNETELESTLNRFHHILENWRTFFNRHYVSMLYKKAAYEMLYEYRTRYFLISAANTNNMQLKPSDLKELQKTTINDIKLFLCANCTHWSFWQYGYKQFIKNKLKTKPYEISKSYNENDLCLNNIYNDIKERLPQLVVENLCSAREEVNMMLVKTHKTRSSKVINSPKKKSAISNAVTEAHQKYLMLKKVQNDKVYINRVRLQKVSSKNIENSVEKPIEKSKSNEQLLTEFEPTEYLNKKPRVENIMHTAESNKNLTIAQNINSDDLDSSTEEINMQSSADNSAETIEIANIKKFHISDQTSFLARTLHNDPIITSYRILSKLSDLRKHIPIYREAILRKAFKETFKDNNIEHYSECQPQDLRLYKKLLLLYFSDTAKFMNRIHDIMICFDKTSINVHLANASNIIIEWLKFFDKNLSRLLYKQAIYEILYEYTKRYLRCQKEISDKTLMQTAEKIQSFLRCHIILPAQWLQHFRDLFESRQNSCTNNIDSVQTSHKIKAGSYKLNENDLDISTIYEFVNHRINPLVTDTLLNGSTDSDHVVKLDKKVEDFSSLKVMVDVKQFENDPIIKTYFELANHSATKLPVFNEELLHSAFNSVFLQFMKPDYYNDNYKVYRKLILFKYSEQCYTIDEVAKIMICFSKKTIRRYFKGNSVIMRKWRAFNDRYLPIIFFQQGMREMLYEYTRRFIYFNWHVTDNHLKRKAIEIKHFFGQNFNMPINWLRDVGRKFRNELQSAKKDDNIKFTRLDLKLENIYESVKSQLHPYVIEKREAIVQTQKKQENVFNIESEEVVMDNLELKENEEKEFLLNQDLNQTEASTSKQDDEKMNTSELILCRIQTDFEGKEEEELDNIVMKIL